MTKELTTALEKLEVVKKDTAKLAPWAMPKIASFIKTMKLLKSVATMESHKVFRQDGTFYWSGQFKSSMDELKRPPLVLTHPASKKEWSQEEIEEFYKANPMLNV